MNFFRRKQEADSLPPFQYKLERVKSSDAVQRCISLRGQGNQALTPLILDSPEKFFVPVEERESVDEQIKETLAAAEELSAQEWFVEKRNENPTYLEELEGGEWPSTPDRIEPRI